MRPNDTELTELTTTMNTGSATAAYVSRQPIYRKHMDVYGYELLFRDSATDRANVVDGDSATAQVILNFIEFGFDEIIREHLAFVNLTDNFILEGHCRSLPKDRVVLEVLEDVTAAPEIVRALRKLKDEGYIIALDDFVYDESLRPLVELANIIKVDVMATDRAGLEKQVPLLQKFNVRLLAEKVESQDEFDFCSALGFDYFQGYFFCKPKLIEGKQIPTNRLAATRLVSKLQSPDIKGDELEETIRQDVTLSYKLLRFVNSAYCALPRHVDSIKHAAMLIGVSRLRTWASLLMLASMDDKPRELMVTGIVRAKMCEELATANGFSTSERFFTVGLFSVLDAMLDSRMEDILEKLPLSKEISQALITHEELLGNMLDFTIAYEQGNWERLAEVGSALELDPPAIRTAYMNAVKWTMEITNELNI